MKNLRTVIFDFGDTLVTLAPPKETIVSGFLSSKGITVDIGEIKGAYRIVDYGNRQSALRLKTPDAKRDFLLHINKELLKALGLSKDQDRWSEELYGFFSGKKKWEVFSDTAGALDEIKRLGYDMAVLANWDGGLRSLAGELGLSRYFSSVLSSGELSVEKPDPDVFSYLLKSLSLRAEDALYVGNDYELDVICARGAGIGPVLIDRPHFYPHADCLRFEDLKGLAGYLRRDLNGGL